MKSSLLLVIAGLLILLVAMISVPFDLHAAGPAPQAETLGYQLLVNPGVELYDPPYAQYRDADCQVASGWQRFWSGDLEPAWMDTRVFDRYLGCNCWVERIEGQTSQLLVSTEPYNAGIRQQVGGLVPGLGYGFHAAMLTIFQSSAAPVVDGTMIKQVGMDPTGGTDPQAPSVVWCEPDDRDEAWSINLRTAAYAQSPTMTVFIRVISPFESGGWPYVNLGFLDSAILARTPVVTATSPAVSAVPTFTVRWDNAVAAPGGGYLREWHDVQWLDEVEGVWRDWFVKTDKVEALFVGELGHTYHFRARVWQRYPNGAHLYGPWNPERGSATRVGGAQLQGQVLTPQGYGLAGATVVLSGTTHVALSGAGGRYQLDLPAFVAPLSITVSHPNWLAPAAVRGFAWGPTGTLSLTWTLCPPGDVVTNGEFESGLAGWSPLAGPGLAPRVVSEPLHTGLGALALGGSAQVSFTAGLTQTVVLTGAWEPGLSLWYQPLSADLDDLFHIVLTLVTETVSTTLTLSPPLALRATFPLTEPITPTPPITGPITTTLKVTTTSVYTPPLDVEGWQHLWYNVGPPERALTGTVTIRFQVWNDGDAAPTTVYLDEVSLAATPGGPFKAYLPLVSRQFWQP